MIYFVPDYRRRNRRSWPVWRQIRQWRRPPDGDRRHCYCLVVLPVAQVL